MSNLTFKKYGLSPEEIENMKKFNLKLDKRTTKQLISAYQTEAVDAEEIAKLETLIDFSLPADYAQFLLEHNGVVPSKTRIKGTTKVIDHFLAIKSAYKYNSITDLYETYAKIGIPIGNSPSGDVFLMDKDAKIYYFDHNFGEIDTKIGCIATSFSDFLEMLY